MAQGRHRHRGPAPVFLNAAKMSRGPACSYSPIHAAIDQLLSVFLVEAAHHAEAEADRKPFAAYRLKRAIPFREIDIDRPHFHAMFACITHELRGRVETHGLRIEDGGKEHRSEEHTSELQSRFGISYA